MQKIRVGIVGVGGVSYRHIHGFMESPDAEIAALCDVDPSRIAAAKEKAPELRDVPSYQDLGLLLKAGRLDAVEISTPHVYHYEQVMDALNAGLHVLVEKPVACNAIQARDIVARAQESGKVVMVVYQRHFKPQYRYIKRMVQSGQLGEIIAVSALQSQSWKASQKGTWRLDPSLSGGGQLNDSGSHLLDMILWTSGLAVESVRAFIDNRGTLVDIDSSIAIKFTNGALGNVTIVGDSVCRWHEDFTIWGTKGIIFYRNGRLTYCDAQGEMRDPLDLPESGNTDQSFCDAVLGRDENWVPPECGLHVIELAEAAWRSAQSGCGVSIAELYI
ncbi:MAG: Gfo/Idh/MocA family oxidoreductase [Armatimonadota bacterium]|nr:Gfo/Idh/MocA family oxidoreductase [bacterium]